MKTKVIFGLLAVACFVACSSNTRSYHSPPPSSQEPQFDKNAASDACFEMLDAICVYEKTCAEEEGRPLNRQQCLRDVRERLSHMCEDPEEPDFAYMSCEADLRAWSFCFEEGDMMLSCARLFDQPEPKPAKVEPKPAPKPVVETKEEKYKACTGMMLATCAHISKCSVPEPGYYFNVDGCIKQVKEEYAPKMCKNPRNTVAEYAQCAYDISTQCLGKGKIPISCEIIKTG